MKVLIISAAYPPMQAGEATNAYYLCQQLASRGMEVHVLTSQGNQGGDDPYVHIHPIMNDWSWTEMFMLRSFVKQCAPQAVYLMYIGLMYHFHPMITFVPTLIKRMFPRVPVVTRYESAFVGADPSRISIGARIFRKLMIRWAGTRDVAYSSGTLLRDSNYIIALCERHRDMLIEEWSPVQHKLRIIPPPPNLRVAPAGQGQTRLRGRQKLGLNERDFVITFFGYLYPLKGIETLLQAFSLVYQDQKDARLLFIGGKVDLEVIDAETYYDEMQLLARQLQIDMVTRWTGSIKGDTEEASLYLHASDICVLPLLEGVHLNNSSFASVMAHGLPTIVSKGPRTDRAIVDSESVLTFDPRDHHTLARLIRHVMEDGQIRDKLRQGAIRFADEYFAWDKAIEQTLLMLQAHTRDQI
jgi:glycosyltransferase involved in cell wall biosynthesis